MSESILKALMRLFAIIANFDTENVTGRARGIVEAYLKQHLNQELIDEYLKLFDEFFELHHSKKSNKRVSSNSVKVLRICEQINEELRQEQKMLVLLQLLEFIRYGEAITENEFEFVKTVADTFNISEIEYNNAKSFILDLIDDVPQKDNLLIINNDSSFSDSQIKHIYNENIHGKIVVLNISSTNMYVARYIGESNLTMNGHIIQPNYGYILDKGSSIRGQKVNPIYYSDIAGKFLYAQAKSKITFTAKDIEFRFKNSSNGIHKFTFSEESGNLIGIMGGSGVGKSTLLNVLNGNLKPNEGNIFINGYDIHENKEILEGVIGFIPQDDLLIEELTVYQNLYYNAKLCFSKFNEEEINNSVNKILLDLDLYEIRHLKVGGPLNKFISGGQRKRLNIALELIREPSVLFVDEPTSGLSSMDSEMVMDLLKEQTLKSKLVIVNIHQPSSDIYKLFDKILIMDKGGFPVYYGNPLDAVVYFKRMSHYVNADESECISCGNVNPEQVLQIVEAKVVNEYGKLTRTRKIKPQEWYELYKKNIESKQTTYESKDELKKNFFKVPSKIKQFFIFTTRDVLSKLTNKQYLLLNFLEAPVLAVILGFFTKYIQKDTYIFSENENLPAYIFMAVVVALFLGLTVSAEEIIKDRKILQRESFLNLSRVSYINSKVIIMFTLSAIQTLSFILVGNFILGIKGMTFIYWMVLFSTSCFANMLGLNISSALNSVVTIYILIPFILVPQLLLSGVIVKFDKLHKNITSHVYVPFVGDLMTSRWAYEALAVAQFKDNKYEKNFFDIEKEKSDALFIYQGLVTELQNRLDYCESNISKKVAKDTVTKYLNIIKNEIAYIKSISRKNPYNYSNSLTIKSFNSDIALKTRDYLDRIKNVFNEKFNNASDKYDRKVEKLLKSLTNKNDIFKLKEENHNNSLSDLVTNKTEFNLIYEGEDRIIRIKDPIFKFPESNFGRAHFYSPVKKLFGQYIVTPWFNVGAIWFTSLLLYIALCFDLLKKLLNISDKIKFKVKPSKEK